uniref:Matrin-type domain-containing protein n=1 Tax=Chelonoidis abingdonii TaxID=106734 RepID=A0A8C0GCA1_CHEAB
PATTNVARVKSSDDVHRRHRTPNWNGYEQHSSKNNSYKGLDFLVPKAGYFCQICSLFYAGEMSMKNHCKTLRHQQNMEKFMAKQKDGEDEEEDEGEELSSR